MNTDSIEIRQLGPQDHIWFSAGVALLNETQGIGLFAADYVETRVSDNDSYVLGAFDHGRLIGLAVAQIIQDLSFHLPFDPLLSDKLAGKKVGSFATLCFADRYRGQGLGQRMSLLRLDWLKQQNCDAVLGVSWVSGLPHTSNRVFQKMGFQKVKHLENFFYQSSIERPFICPGCGEPPCTCPAELYFKWLT